MKKKLTVAVMFILTLIILLGLINQDNYRGKFLELAKAEIIEHLRKQGDSDFEFLEADYTLFSLEIDVRTERGEYYAVVSDLTHPLVQHVFLNLFVAPRVELNYIEPVK